MNKVILIGNLTKDPELTTTNNGVSVCRFTLAISRRYANAEGERETDFINVVVWRNLADNCHKFLKKGSKTAVVGNIQTRSYDANDGTKRYVTEVVAEEVEFISTKSDSVRADSTEEVAKLEPISDDSLPF
ncbi:MAG: single-stranded DNA-binding protein [Clostridia bacterium]|nr:single-stranded DNA-binding protein [Clostridia bacterium]